MKLHSEELEIMQNLVDSSREESVNLQRFVTGFQNEINNNLSNFIGTITVNSNF